MQRSKPQLKSKEVLLSCSPWTYLSVLRRHCTGAGVCCCTHKISSKDLMGFHTDSSNRFLAFMTLVFRIGFEGIIFSAWQTFVQVTLICWLIGICIVEYLIIMWLKPFYCSGPGMHAKVKLLQWSSDSGALAHNSTRSADETWRTKQL